MKQLQQLLAGNLLKPEKRMSTEQDVMQEPMMSVGEPASFEKNSIQAQEMDQQSPMEEVNKQAKSENLKTKEEKEEDGKKKNSYAKFLGDFSENTQGLNSMKGVSIPQYQNRFNPSDEMGSLRSQVLQAI